MGLGLLASRVYASGGVPCVGLSPVASALPFYSDHEQLISLVTHERGSVKYTIAYSGILYNSYL